MKRHFVPSSKKPLDFSEPEPKKQRVEATTADEIDPLDAFMASIEEERKAITGSTNREFFEQEDNAMESYIEASKKTSASSSDYLSSFRRSSSTNYDSDEEVYAVAKAIDQDERLKDRHKSSKITEYDENDNPIFKDKNDKYTRDIEIAPKDHSKVNYRPFEKNFYTPCSEIENLTEDQVEKLRRDLEIRVGGYDVPAPVSNFDQFGLDRLITDKIRLEGFRKPTPIQSQGIPCILSGRDIIGLAKTGSGKTATYVWPMIAHVMDQEELKRGEGPIALILTPTRELCIQIQTVIKKYCSVFGVRSLAIHGGASKTEQFKSLKKGVDVVVAAPGRLLDLIQLKACNLNSVTYLVLDEADIMFNMGFEPQVRSIMGQIRPDRQTLMFSATFDPKIERLARDALTTPVRIAVGTHVGMANSDVTQVVAVIDSGGHKWHWLADRIHGFLYPDQENKTERKGVLIFVGQKEECDLVALKLNQIGCLAGSIHGDKTQDERQDVIKAFKNKVIDVLVATDIASRGLDIPHVKTVVNYDLARDIDTHVHRIGRTGRAGDTEGVAYTLITKNETEFASKLVRSLEDAGQQVSKALMQLASRDPMFQINHSLPKNAAQFRSKRNMTGLGFPQRFEDSFMPGFKKVQTVQPEAPKQIVIEQPSLKKKGFEIIPALKPNPSSNRGSNNQNT